MCNTTLYGVMSNIIDYRFSWLCYRCVSRILSISVHLAKSSGIVDDCDSRDLHCLVLLHILLAISRGTLLIFGRTSALISIYTTSTVRDDNSASLQFPWILIVMAHNGDIGVYRHLDCFKMRDTILSTYEWSHSL